MRRSCCSPVHPKVAQERLGHSTVTTTLDRYSPVTPAMQEDAADSLDATLRGAMMAYTGPKKRSVAISVATAVSGPPEGAGKTNRLNYIRRVSTVAVQRFCKPKVGGSNPSPGTIIIDKFRDTDKVAVPAWQPIGNQSAAYGRRPQPRRR